MTGVSPLIVTKTSRPLATADGIRRERLCELMQAGWERPLILVSAPAGYGKTTLVNSWLCTLDAE